MGKKNDSGNEEEFEVEAVRGKRIVKGKAVYFIKWKGYPESDNTWEPEDNVTCPELIAKYEKEQQEKQERRKKEEIKKEESKKKDVDSKKKEDSKKVEVKKEKKDDSKKVDSKGDDSKKKDESIVKKKSESKVDSQKKKRSNADTSSSSNSASSKKHKSDSEDESKELVGFARGLKPAKIMGATEVDGQLKFLMAWVGTEDTEMVLAKEANFKCPQLVIDFYEERLTWHNIDDSKRGKK